MGLFDSLISGVSNFLGGGASPDSPDAVSADLSGLPSELGGTLLDQLTGAGGSPADLSQSVNFGGAASDPFGGIFGSDPLSTLFTNTGPNALDTSTPIVAPSGSGGGMGTDLAGLGAFGPFIARHNRGVPWKRISRMIRTAVKQFGPGVALAIVQQLAAMLQANGVQDASGNAITGGELLYRALASSSSGRRNRGITGRQLAVTSKTIRKLNTMHARIAAIAGRSFHRSRSAPTPFRRRRAR